MTTGNVAVDASLDSPIAPETKDLQVARKYIPGLAEETECRSTPRPLGIGLCSTSTPLCDHSLIGCTLGCLI